MAELRESVLNPDELVNRINPPVVSMVRFVDNVEEETKEKSETAEGNKEEGNKEEDKSDSDSDTDTSTEVVANQLDSYFSSLSNMLEDVDTNHLKLIDDTNRISHTVATIKLDIDGMRDTYLSSMDDIRKELAELKRMIMNNRNSHMTVLEKSMSSVKARLDKLEQQ